MYVVPAGISFIVAVSPALSVMPVALPAVKSFVSSALPVLEYSTVYVPVTLSSTLIVKSFVVL